MPGKKGDDHTYSDSARKPTEPLPAFDEKPRTIHEERIRKNDPVISDTYKPPPSKKP